MPINWEKVYSDTEDALKHLPVILLGGLAGFFGPELLIRYNPLGIEASEPELAVAYLFGGLFFLIASLGLIILYLTLKNRYVVGEKN